MVKRYGEITDIEPLLKGRRGRITGVELEGLFDQFEIILSAYETLYKQFTHLIETATVKRFLDVSEKLKTLEEIMKNLGYNLALDKLGKDFEEIKRKYDQYMKSINEVRRVVKSRATMVEVLVKNLKLKKQEILTKGQISTFVSFLKEYLNLSEEQLGKINDKLNDLFLDNMSLSGDMEILVKKVDDIEKVINEIKFELKGRKVVSAFKGESLVESLTDAVRWAKEVFGMAGSRVLAFLRTIINMVRSVIDTIRGMSMRLSSMNRGANEVIDSLNRIADYEDELRRYLRL